MVTWTAIQKQRLQELGASDEQLDSIFNNDQERNFAYQKYERDLVDRGKEALLEYRQNIKKPALMELESRLAEALISAGFAQVSTPILLSKGLLAKMTITEDKPLYKQVFWVDSSKCLRPMLAPNLYYLLKDLLRLWPSPVSIFEIGPCFRKDTQGGTHLQEFTMLNLVEMGLPEKGRSDRLKELAALVMDAAGLSHYSHVTETSDVYGNTTDIEAGGIELGSGAMGPHVLDCQWNINVPWVGIGFGIERLVMVKEGYKNVQKAGRSLSYLNGIRLNI
ncbi:MAG: pyrrolysine--tRNA(Pyl) ligase large subunit [Bacillota bacterium]